MGRDPAERMQVRQQHNTVTESLAASNRELGTPCSSNWCGQRAWRGLGEMAAGASRMK